LKSVGWRPFDILDGGEPAGSFATGSMIGLIRWMDERLVIN